ncbi:RNA polymerase sigma-54 factor [Paenibacillus pectinilyticus]|uniref:RNA polymerase sigma-54 factor n=2 Tax=Paenibacillus pectinilyticus TaxID=512399 RepID=A0A1C1A0I5_9BACL|nr:RNA polymerase sigma-54 factor [Paenibacillus pectinilyticus]
MFHIQAAKMRMTPQLRKAITILQLSTPELLEVVQQEIVDNPVLEFTRDDGAAYSVARPYQHKRDPNYDYFLHVAASNDVSLETHIKEQLHFVQQISPEMRQILHYMIGNLDHNGYLTVDLPEISKACNVTLTQAERALRILQSFEPLGIGARNIKECLLLQVQSLSESFPIMTILIQNHLQDVAQYRIHKLSTELQVSTQELRTAIDLIKGLNPRPGAAFHIEPVHYLIPEVIVEKAGDQLVVLLHQAASSRLAINGHYERMAQNTNENAEASKFLTGKLHAARFFLKCLDQRRKAIHRVAQAIVEEQSDFFWHGAGHLKPMTLKHIADKLAVHESTVSRATAGKYAQTPWGIFELTYFFPAGLQMEIGETASSEHVKVRIKACISEENIEKPYSDQKLADLLRQEGIHISRRTVTKYREELGISSSVRRKRI